MVAFPDDVPVLFEEHPTRPALRLRAHRPADIDQIVAASNDPSAQDFLHLPHPYTAENAREFVKMVAARWEEKDHPRYHSWAIEADGTYAGNVSVKRKLADAVEIGYLLHSDARGAGVATRAAALALAHARTEWDPSVFHWRASVGNWASRAVAWKLGFTIDGTQPCASVNAYGVAQDEWFGHRAVDAHDAPAHPWWIPITLGNGDVTLRAMTESDDWLGAGVFSAEAESMASGTSVGWVVADAAANPLGHVTLANDGCAALEQSGRIRFTPHEAVGVPAAVDAVLSAVLRHAFAPRSDNRGRSGLGLTRLEATSGPGDNPWSNALLRTGFSIWGHSSHPAREGGASGDQVHFELLRA